MSTTTITIQTISRKSNGFYISPKIFINPNHALFVRPRPDDWRWIGVEGHWVSDENKAIYRHIESYLPCIKDFVNDQFEEICVNIPIELWQHGWMGVSEYRAGRP